MSAKLWSWPVLAFFRTVRLFKQIAISNQRHLCFLVREQRFLSGGTGSVEKIWMIAGKRQWQPYIYRHRIPRKPNEFWLPTCIHAEDSLYIKCVDWRWLGVSMATRIDLSVVWVEVPSVIAKFEISSGHASEDTDTVQPNIIQKRKRARCSVI